MAEILPIRRLTPKHQSINQSINHISLFHPTGTVPPTTPGSLDPTAVRPSPRLPGCPTIITRDEWGAMPPSHAMTLLTETPKYVFIHHGATSACSTQAECSARVRSYQTFHMSAPPAGRGTFSNVMLFTVTFIRH